MPVGAACSWVGRIEGVFVLDTQCEQDVILSLVEINKRFPGVQALKDFCLELRRGRVHGLVGQNGAGKSTAVKIIVGAEQAESGQILLNGKPIVVDNPAVAARHGIIAVHQERQLFPDLSVAENLLAGQLPKRAGGLLVNWKQAMADATRLLSSFDIDLDPTQPISDFGMGIQQMVEIVRSMSRNPSVLVLDEPMTSLSAAETEHLFGFIRSLCQRDVAILFIAHNLDEVFAISDEITVLRDGVRVTTVPAAETNRDQVISWMVGRHVDQFQDARSGQAGDQAPALLEVTDLRVPDWDTIVSLAVGVGEIVGLAGLLGAGAGSIARTIAGVSWSGEGSVYLGGERVFPRSPKAALRSGIAYLPPNRRDLGLFDNMDVTGNVVASSMDQVAPRKIVNGKAMLRLTREAIQELDIRPPEPGWEVVKLSGGNQQKVLFGRLLKTRPRFLILETPTVGVDVAAKAEIHMLIREKARSGIGVLVATIDYQELARLCDRVLIVREGQIAAELRPPLDEENIIALVGKSEESA